MGGSAYPDLTLPTADVADARLSTADHLRELRAAAAAVPLDYRVIVSPELRRVRVRAEAPRRRWWSCQVYRRCQLVATGGGFTPAEAVARALERVARWRRVMAALRRVR